MDLERKPVITYAGDQQVFQHLQNGLVHGIPQERVQWRRSHGRLPCLVSLEATFQPLSDNSLQDDLSSLARRPCLHTYWLDSSDVETYKSSGREPMLRWLNQLRQNNVVDWLIVAVESADTRSKANKLLPRSSVMDRIKQDILSKHGDRCVALVDPSRSDARSAGSLHALLAKMRQLLLVGLNRVLVRFEAAMRSQRDKRTGSSWNFGSYFLLQEELSLALQQLSLLEEALLQYDELEALLNQLIASRQPTGVPLPPFTGRLTDWVGLTVPGSCSEKVRNQISQASVSFLDFRNYLFARQCVLLQRLGRHGEIAQRSLILLFSTTSELRHLQIEAHPGSVSCWAFSTCMHVIDVCQECDSEPTVHLAGLYDQARLKLHELGALCGLLPLIDTDTSVGSDENGERRPSSVQLHLSVTLSAGAGDSHRRLSEALSGADQLRRLYLELAEVATGTYKHVGRLRTARTVGCQLAEFQLGLGRTAHAASLLADAAAGYRREHWQSLATRTHVRLAHCYRLMADNARYIQTCSALAGCLDLDEATHDQYVHNLAEAIVKPASSGCSEQSSGSESRCVISSAGLLSVEYAHSAEGVQASDAGVHVSVVVQVTNRSRVTVPVELGYVDVRRLAADRSRQSSPGGVLKPISDEVPLIDINMEYKQDKSLNAASLVCRNASTLLRRLDSGKVLTSPAPGSGSLSAVKASELDGGQDAIRMSLLDVLLKPGLNELTFQHMVVLEGDYSVSEMLLKTDSVDIVVSLPTVDFSVKFTPLQLSLVYGQAALLSGVAQEMSLQVSCGSKPLAKGGEAALHCSEGLQLRDVDADTDQVWSSRLCLPLPALSPLQRVSLPLLALSELTQNKQTVEHTVKMTGAASVQSCISFHMPFSASFKLHTAGARKYVQVQMCGNRWRVFELQSPELAIEDDSPVQLKSVNDSSTESLIVSGDGDASFLWELLLDDSAVRVTSTRLQFRIQYRDIKSEPRHRFKMDFTLSDYVTLFSVVCAVEPGRGSELCRAGCLCQLHVSIRQLAPCQQLPAVMYEVLADQHAWAVCGTSSGVLTVDSELREHHVQLEVMPLTAGSLPLPTVRLSKYIPAQRETIPLASGGAAGQSSSSSPPAAPAAVGVVGGGAAMPRLEPFQSGQVYSASRGQQVQILAANVAAAALTAPSVTAGGHHTPQHTPRPSSDPTTV